MGGKIRYDRTYERDKDFVQLNFHDMDGWSGHFSTIEIYWKRKGRIIILPPEVRRDIRNRRTAKKRICHMDMISKKFGRERYRHSFWEHLLNEMNITIIQMLTAQEIFSLFCIMG